MQPVSFCIFITALTVSVNALVFTPNNGGPIESVQYTEGQQNGKRLTRVDHLEARITNDHLGRGRVFSHSGPTNELFLAVSEQGDERGHIVANSLGGLAEWYNLTPQSNIANRNKGTPTTAVEQWRNTERKIQKFLKANADGYVDWVVDLTYGDANRQFRPTMYRLKADCYKANGSVDLRCSTDTSVANGTPKF